MSRGIKALAIGCALLVLGGIGLVISLLGAGVMNQQAGSCATDTVPAMEIHTGEPIDVAARATAAAGWTGDDLVDAVAVAGAESGYDPEAKNPTSSARGLFQTMWSLHKEKFQPGEHWSDPFANARVAHILWTESGWQPWTETYASGAYREYLDDARAAVDRLNQDTPTRPAAIDILMGPGPTADGEVISPENTPGWEGLRPVAVEAANFIRTRFDFLHGTIGGFRPGATVYGTNSPSKHGAGLALDIMLDSSDTAENALGDRIADYFRGPGSGAFGVENVIWKQRIANAGNGWGWAPMEDRGSITQNHYDHVHVDFTGTGGTGTAPDVEPVAAVCDPAAVVPAGALVEGALPPPTDGDGAIVATFNVLGHSHTEPGGKRASWPHSATRMRQAVDLLDTYDVTVVGLQEFQGPQRAEFLRLTNGAWGLYHHPGNPQNAIAWRLDTWQSIPGSASTFMVPYFARPQPQTVIGLQHRATDGEVYFVNAHNPASTRGPAAHKRAEAVRRELAVIDRLNETHPVVFVGDMNDRERFYCPVTRAGLHASNGGSNGTRPCRLPRPHGIDWIMGTPEVEFSGHQRITATRDGRISDHPLVTAYIR